MEVPMLPLLCALALAEPPAEDSPPEFARYTVVLLHKGPNWSAEDTPENRALMAQHLEHLRKMTESGKMLAAGPFSDQQDEDRRGLCVYRTPVDEARELARADPRVAAGHLTVEAMSWWTPKGTVAFPAAAEIAAEPAARPGD